MYGGFMEFQLWNVPGDCGSPSAFHRNIQQLLLISQGGGGLGGGVIVANRLETTGIDTLQNIQVIELTLNYGARRLRDHCSLSCVDSS